MLQFPPFYSKTMRSTKSLESDQIKINPERCRRYRKRKGRLDGFFLYYMHKRIGNLGIWLSFNRLTVDGFLWDVGNLQWLRLLTENDVDRDELISFRERRGSNWESTAAWRGGGGRVVWEEKLLVIGLRKLERLLEAVKKIISQLKQI